MANWQPISLQDHTMLSISQLATNIYNSKPLELAQPLRKNLVDDSFINHSRLCKYWGILPISFLDKHMAMGQDPEPLAYPWRGVPSCFPHDS